MQIASMARHIQQRGSGAIAHTHNLLREMLALAPHGLVLLHSAADLFGLFDHGERVCEVQIPPPTALLRNHWAVLPAEGMEGLDLVFNPKYSLPLMEEVAGVLVCHGLDWYVVPKGSKWADRLRHRHLMPRYAQDARGMAAVSNQADDVIEYLHVPSRSDSHGPLWNRETLSRASLPGAPRRSTTHLPPARRALFACWPHVSPKNFGPFVWGCPRVGPRPGAPLVLARQHRFPSEQELALVKQLGLTRWILQAGLADRKLLLAPYALASVFVLLSLHEGSGFPKGPQASHGIELDGSRPSAPPAC